MPPLMQHDDKPTPLVKYNRTIFVMACDAGLLAEARVSAGRRAARAIAVLARMPPRARCRHTGAHFGRRTNWLG